VVFTARRYDSAVYAVVVMSVCPPVSAGSQTTEHLATTVDVAKCFQHRRTIIVACVSTQCLAQCTLRWSIVREAASCGPSAFADISLLVETTIQPTFYDISIINLVETEFDVRF